MAVNLYDHQKQAVAKMKTGSVLCGGVGTGKSRTALAYFYTKVCKGRVPGRSGYYKEMLEPTSLYIITTARKRDTKEWDAEMAPFLMSTEKGVGPVDVVVDSWNNIGKYVNVKSSFFIFDEQRLVGTGAWTKAFWKIAKKNRWILLSATPGDTWIDYAPVFIANGYYRNITDFRNQHVVYHRYAKFPKIERYINTRKLEYIRSQVVIKMEYQKTATQHHEWVKVVYSEELYDLIVKNRWNVYENRPIQNASEFCYILRKAVNSDERRCRAIANLLKTHPKMIVFYNFDYELDRLHYFSDAIGIECAEWNGHKHELLPTGDKWLYFVQYTAGAEGWNCITTDTILFYSQNYSYRATVQAAGRIDRMNTPFTDLYYYHLFSDAGIDYAIRRCLKEKRNFNEKIFSQEVEFA